MKYENCLRSLLQSVAPIAGVLLLFVVFSCADDGGNNLDPGLDDQNPDADTTTVADISQLTQDTLFISYVQKIAFFDKEPIVIDSAVIDPIFDSYDNLDVEGEQLLADYLGFENYEDLKVYIKDILTLGLQIDQKYGLGERDVNEMRSLYKEAFIASLTQSGAGISSFQRKSNASGRLECSDEEIKDECREQESDRVLEDPDDSCARGRYNSCLGDIPPDVFPPYDYNTIPGCGTGNILDIEDLAELPQACPDQQVMRMRRYFASCAKTYLCCVYEYCSIDCSKEPFLDKYCSRLIG